MVCSSCWDFDASIARYIRRRSQDRRAFYLPRPFPWYMISWCATSSFHTHKHTDTYTECMVQLRQFVDGEKGEKGERVFWEIWKVVEKIWQETRSKRKNDERTTRSTNGEKTTIYCHAEALSFVFVHIFNLLFITERSYRSSSNSDDDDIVRMQNRRRKKRKETKLNFPMSQKFMYTLHYTCSTAPRLSHISLSLSLSLIVRAYTIIHTSCHTHFSHHTRATARPPQK